MRKYRLNKGILIAIEGIDGAGKTTQVHRLTDHFKRLGFLVERFKEPTDGIYGQQIRDLARNGRHTVTPEQEFEIFLKDRIEDCALNIFPAIEKKKLVLMDRYYFSNVAYQGSLGMDTKHILQRNEEIAKIPDLVIVIDVAPKIGLSRIKYLRKEEHNHFEKEEYLDRVRKLFLDLDFSYLQKIDGSMDEDTVFNHLKNIAQDIIAPYLWEDDSQIDLFVQKRHMENSTYSNN